MSTTPVVIRMHEADNVAIVANEGGLPAGLTAAPEAHDAWFRAKVQEALADTRSTVPHQQVMDEAQALIDRKRRARS